MPNPVPKPKTPQAPAAKEEEDTIPEEVTIEQDVPEVVDEAAGIENIPATENVVRLPVKVPQATDYVQPNWPARIQMIRAYTGVLSREEPVYPGVYAIDDPALYGNGQYFVDHGYAEWF